MTDTENTFGGFTLLDDEEEFDELCLLLCDFQFAQLIVHYPVICPNLLNRMQNDEGWLTHLFAGVESQSEIPSANHLHLKGKAKAVTPSLIYY